MAMNMCMLKIGGFILGCDNVDASNYDSLANMSSSFTGPDYIDLGPGGYHYYDLWDMVFNCNETVNLKSVDIYAESSFSTEIEILDFNYFIDIGNVWGVDYNSSLDKSKIRSSTGIGLNVLTPVGPLSFSLAQPITKASSDKTETFRFNLGTTF